MAASLKGRLARLRELGLRPASEEASRPGEGERIGARKARGPKRSRAEAAPPSFLKGWKKIGDLVWSRELSARARFPEAIDPRPFCLGRSSRTQADEGKLPREDFRFFDFETSGLSGGAGTVAFLAAVGRFEGADFLVRQFFLEDYPGEAEYLEALLAELGEGGRVMTYNGKSFDLPLLRTRCVMNGIAPPVFRDLDALACARRLWRRVHGGASLGLLEREVLGLEREEDVPGSEIPGIWFEYLRRGDHPLMPAVMAHNASDVASLASLAARIDSAFARPRKLAASSAVDRYGLGRGLLILGRDSEGEELLEAAAAEGEEAAGLFLSRRYRREGRIEDRRRVVGMLPETVASCVERAKYYEHAERDFEEALRWARRALALASYAVDEEALGLRIARIERKAARKGGA